MAAGRAKLKHLQVRRVYDPPGADEGTRVLVDRIWPRGLSKESAGIDLWLKEAAPSTDLRKWFAHDPDKWEEFKRRYFAELDANPDALAPLRQILRKGALTLVYAAREPNFNNAVALREYLRRR